MTWVAVQTFRWTTQLQKKSTLQKISQLAPLCRYRSRSNPNGNIANKSERPSGRSFFFRGANRSALDSCACPSFPRTSACLGSHLFYAPLDDIVCEPLPIVTSGVQSLSLCCELFGCGTG